MANEQQASTEPPLRKVRVQYTRAADSPNGGWDYNVLAAETDSNGHLVYLGGGWSAGKKADAVQDFERMAKAKGWTL